MASVLGQEASAPASGADAAAMSAYRAAMEPVRAALSPRSAEIEEIQAQARAREASTQGRTNLFHLLKTGDWDLLRVAAKSLKNVLTQEDKEAVCRRAESFTKKTAFRILCQELGFTYEEGPD